MTVDHEEFVAGYVDAMLWTESVGAEVSERIAIARGEEVHEDESMRDVGFTRADVAKSGGMANVNAACESFCRANAADLDLYCEERSYDLTREEMSVSSYAGHDFWLTRNGHGAGFWDRGLGALGDRLTAAANAFGETYAYVGDDDLIYVS